MSVFLKVKKLVSDNFKSWNHLDTGWDNRLYSFYLIFGQTDESKSPWIVNNWKSDFEPFFDLPLKQTQDLKETGIRATKYRLEKKISEKDNQEFIYHSDIKLGRLRWDDRSHEKWTTPNINESYFLNFELWTPIWTICDKRQSPPDIYISICNERDFENKRDIKFGYFIVLAIAEDLNIDSKSVVREFSLRVNSRATILKTRKWGKSEKVGNWTFLNWIQDTSSNGIYKGDNLHKFDFEELEFEPVWEVIHREK